MQRHQSCRPGRIASPRGLVVSLGTRYNRDGIAYFNNENNNDSRFKVLLAFLKVKMGPSQRQQDGRHLAMSGRTGGGWTGV